ncbi:MAG: M23 family metallopeptidase, partial [Sphingomonadales bacterium]
PLKQVEQRQVALAGKARAAGEARYQQTAAQIRRLGLTPERYSNVAMGGPYEPVDANDTTADSDAASADAQFRALFQTWKKLDMLEQTVISIPSMQPVDKLLFTSNFGVRSDPFRGTAAMHAGVDIPGALGTPIYATADGIISHAGRQGGYGNLVQINHGRGIETRYGHLSKILIADNTRVKRGQMIGLMGSTGRSTGSHLHYEVRVDGKAVNPIPFLQTGEYLVQIQDRAAGTAVGGPAN